MLDRQAFRNEYYTIEQLESGFRGASLLTFRYYTFFCNHLNGLANIVAFSLCYLSCPSVIFEVTQELKSFLLFVFFCFFYSAILLFFPMSLRIEQRATGKSHCVCIYTGV